MSAELIVEVLRHAPASLTPAEKLLLTVIAESCNPITRMTWYRAGWDAAEVARRAHLTAGSLSKTFWSLAQKGCEVRVAHGVDKNGKPVFAFKGKQTTFKLPRFAPRGAATEPDAGAAQRSDEDRTFNAPPDAKGPTYVGRRSDEDRTLGGQRSDVRRTLLLKELPSKNTSPPPTPSDALARFDVIDAEIVEEGEDATSSLEPQIQNLIDEAVAAKPNWCRKRQDIRDQIDALLLTFDGNFDLVGQVVRETALAADSGFPARITLAQNPAMVRANAAYMIAKADAVESFAVPQQLHPEAHPFEAQPESRMHCRVCSFPEPNQRHKVGNQGGGYVGRPINGRADGRHQPFRNPPIGAYYGEL